MCSLQLAAVLWRKINKAHYVLFYLSFNLPAQLFMHGNIVLIQRTTVFQHEDYRDRAPWPNDIALLKLSAPVSLGGRTIRTACIPSSSYEFTAADDCWITGWGDSKGMRRSLLLINPLKKIIINDD